MLEDVVATKGFNVEASVPNTDVLATLEEVGFVTVIDWDPLVELSESPSIRAMTSSVSSVGSSTSSVTGDVAVVFEAVAVPTPLELLLVDGSEVGLATVVELDTVEVAGVESSFLSVLGVGEVFSRLVAGVSVTPSVLTLPVVVLSGLVLLLGVVSASVVKVSLVEVPSVGGSVLLPSVVSASVVTTSLIEVSSVGGSVLLLGVVSASVVIGSLDEVSSVEGSLLLLSVVAASVIMGLLVEVSSVGGSVLLLGVV